jgi:Winged helix DNA-binding domain
VTARELNRALLARQLLLERVSMPIGEAVEHLVGLQAQAPMPPYYGLWSRLDGFDPHELGRMLTAREVVRLTLMRATVHLVTPRDAVLLRPLVQPAIERNHKGAFGRRMGGAEPAAIATAVRELLGTDGGLTAREIATALVERGIGDDVEAIGNAVRAYVPLVQLPPRGVWGAGGRDRYATLEAWTGLELVAEPSVDDVVLRYLRAFGPASVMDVQNWSGLTRLAAVFERLRDRLVAFADENGRELFDLPDAPRPDPDVPAPVRFLGEYDNVLLGHADRSRIIPAGFPWGDMLAHGRFVNNLLVDGMLRATWWLEPEALAIRPYGAPTARERDEVEAEARALVALLGEERDVRFEPPVGTITPRG